MARETIRLSSSVGDLRGVGPALQKKLSGLGIKTVKDLLLYIPSRLEDRSNVQAVAELRPAEPAVIKVVVDNVHSRKSQRGVLIIQAKVRDESGSINALWFNQRYLLSFLQPGRTYFLFGEKRLSKPLGHPFFVKKIISAPELAPIYPATDGVNQAIFRRLLADCRPLLTKLPDIVPAEIARQNLLPSLAHILARAHFPQDELDLAAARARLAFEELLLLALSIEQQKRLQNQQPARPVAVDYDFVKKVTAAWPFPLTPGQKKAAWEILEELKAGRRVRRLLYGEVGSGKTAVAALVAASVIIAGGRVVVVVPTTTLAMQQTERFRQFLAPANQTVGTLTGPVKNNHAQADLVVATHAAFYHDQALQNVELVILDEQHRFGVKQRQALLENEEQRHVLMMTATPIPRSLAQTIFGSLAISYLAGRPSHQQTVTTRCFAAQNRTAVEKEIEERLRDSQPGYVICPLIEPGETVAVDLFSGERKTVESEAKRLRQRFPAARIALLHGRLDEKTKQNVIDDFQSGRVDILVSTTVVEVGIDNPRATWILIEEADRFGLSQLHQLRGRVGRGDQASICFLADSGTSPIGAERLRLLEQNADGLTLAEHDLRLRGPGELTGLEQSGLPPLKYVDWSKTDSIRKVFAISQQLLDDGLEQYPKLNQAFARYVKDQNEDPV